MIEQVMYFMLGALMAGLLTIAALPALWRRAVRLTRARLEATLPLAPDEIAAEKDQIRARFVVDMRRAEQRVESAEAELHHAKAEIGTQVAVLQEREALLAKRLDQINGLDQELTAAKTDIAMLQDQLVVLTRERDNASTLLSAARITNEGLEQEISNARTLADQMSARAGELEAQAESIATRLSESASVNNDLRASIRQKNEELRTAARSARELTSERASFERKVLASDSIAKDRATTIDALQAERLRLIDEAGEIGRERDAEKLERVQLTRQIDNLKARMAETDASTSKDRLHAQEAIRDLTRTIDQLKNERRAFDEELSALRFTKARLETDLRRFKKQQPLATETETSSATVPPLEAASTKAPGF